MLVQFLHWKVTLHISSFNTVPLEGSHYAQLIVGSFALPLWRQSSYRDYFHTLSFIGGLQLTILNLRHCPQTLGRVVFIFLLHHYGFHDSANVWPGPASISITWSCCKLALSSPQSHWIRDSGAAGPGSLHSQIPFTVSDASWRSSTTVVNSLCVLCPELDSKLLWTHQPAWAHNLTQMSSKISCNFILDYFLPLRSCTVLFSCC